MSASTMITSQWQQSLLSLVAPSWPNLASFVVGHNETTLLQLQTWLQHKKPTIAQLVAPSGSGKTHLAQALLREAYLAGQHCAYIAGQDKDELSPAMLRGMEQLSLLCVDDAQRFWQDVQWQTAIVELLLRMRDTGGVILLVSSKPISLNEWFGLTFQLQPISAEADKRLLLTQQAAERDIKLSKDVENWLIKNYADDLGQLMHVLAYLDMGSITLKRAITLPFAKQLLLKG